MIEKLKSRWGLESNLQVFLVFFIFAITGSSTMFVRKPVFHWLEVDKADTPMVEYISLYILVIMPAYQMLFLFWGTLFGQFKFVWAFEQKMYKRLMILTLIAGLIYAGFKLT